MKKVYNDDAFFSELTSLFLVEGISALTVGGIAAHLRCSRRRLYEFADTKEALFCIVVRRHFDAVLDAGKVVLNRADGDVAAQLIDYLHIGVTAGENLGTAFLVDLEMLPEAKKIFDEYQHSRASRTHELLEKGIHDGVFVPCHALTITEAMRAAAFTLRQPDFLIRANLTIDQAFDELYRVLLGGLLAKRPPEVRSSKIISRAQKRIRNR